MKGLIGYRRTISTYGSRLTLSAVIVVMHRGHVAFAAEGGRVRDDGFDDRIGGELAAAKDEDWNRWILMK